MRRGRALWLAASLLTAGCAAPVVMQSPTGEMVNCSAQAAGRLPAGDPLVTHPTGSVPPPPGATQSQFVYDYVRQCVAALKRDGWVCRSGCPAP